MLLLHLILVGVLATLTGAADIEAQTIVADSCPNEDKPNEVVVIASNSTCSEYYRCHQGQAIKQRCKRNQNFNPNTGRCDFSINAACLGGIPDPELCPPHSRKTYAVKGHCDLYYVCYRGNLFLRSCGNGQLYNEDIGGCGSFTPCFPEIGISFRGTRKPTST